MIDWNFVATFIVAFSLYETIKFTLKYIFFVIINWKHL